jgi:SWI/SNF-related matrix-associated actin-dependent regulator 1 of chromatin subfamily A
MSRSMPNITYTKGELRELIRESPGYAVACLSRLYSFQTTEEQCVNGTIEQNGAGFNSCDGNILSDFARFYKERGYLTDRQLDLVRRAIPKYLGQLEGLPITPLPFRSTHEVCGTVEKTVVVPPNEKVATIVGEFYQIRFPYDATTVELVKTLSGRKWNAEGYYWTAPVTTDNDLSLRDWGFERNGETQALDKLIPEISERLAILEGKPVPRKTQLLKTIPGLKKDLYPYQLDGVQYIEDKNGRALIADDMGLGKTAQALAWAQLHPEHRPLIIVVPASLKLNWEREIRSWTTFGNNTQIVEGRYSPSNKLRAQKDVVIINYDILTNTYIYADGNFCWIKLRKEVAVTKSRYVYEPYTGWVDHLVDIKPQLLITDESQYWKNNDAGRTVAVKALAKATPYFIPLSGTPLENRPEELFNVINAVNDKIFPHYFHYCKRYCGAVHTGFGWDFSGASNIPELHAKLTASIMIRRKKCDVLKDLPPKVRSVVPVEINNRREYASAEANFIEWVHSEYGEEKANTARNAEALVRIEGLKQLATKGKLDVCVTWIRDFLASGEKLVVFCTHQNVVDRLMKEFSGCAVRIDGTVPPGPKRQAAVDAFQNNPKITLLAGNLIAAGVGLTLTAASNTCTIELAAKPGLHFQAEDRVHRIGQTAESVNAWYLVAVDTIENDIMALLDAKHKVLAQVLDGEEVESTSLLTDLLKNYKKR